MKNIKINLDRPQLESSQIDAMQNFEEVLAGHKFMAKPFYKSSWFLGTAGLASLGLIVGGALSFKLEPDESLSNQEVSLVTTDAPPEETKIIPLTAFMGNVKVKGNALEPQSKETQSIINIAYAETPTLFKEEKITEEISPEIIGSDQTNVEKEVTSPKVFTRFDLHPRISGKINGDITRKELLDNNGLVTNSDVEIISFELHIIDASGGHVFTQEGHELSEEMKNSILKTEPGQTIYFEKVRGRSSAGIEVDLNPLRYNLLN